MYIDIPIGGVELDGVVGEYLSGTAETLRPGPAGHFHGLVDHERVMVLA